MSAKMTPNTAKSMASLIRILTVFSLLKCLLWYVTIDDRVPIEIPRVFDFMGLLSYLNLFMVLWIIFFIRPLLIKAQE